MSKFDSGTAALFFLLFLKIFHLMILAKMSIATGEVIVLLSSFFTFFCFEFFFCGLFDDPCQDVDGNREDDGAVVLC